jgi:pimeloyl-ACP methyl ester carboxylesterase
MEKEFRSIRGCKIAYVEINAEGAETIFFIHGNSGSAKNWLFQLQDPWLKRYRLVALDLPGHGNSSRSVSPFEDFSPVNTGKIISEVIEQLSSEKPFCLVGFSYGTNVVAEAAQYLNPTGIAMLSPCIIGAELGLDKLKLNPASIFLKPTVLIQEAENFYLKNLLIYTEQKNYIKDYYSTQKEFRTSLMENVLAGNFSDEIEIIKSFHIPILILFGEEDTILDKDYLDDYPMQLFNESIYKLPGAGHFVQTDKPGSCNEILYNYVNDRFTISRLSEHNGSSL